MKSEESTTSGIPEGSGTDSGKPYGQATFYPQASPLSEIMDDLQKVCEGQPMPVLTQKILSVMPHDKEGADKFVAQLRRLKEAGERVYSEGLQAYFALAR